MLSLISRKEIITQFNNFKAKNNKITIKCRLAVSLFKVFIQDISITSTMLSKIAQIALLSHVY